MSNRVSPVGSVGRWWLPAVRSVVLGVLLGVCGAGFSTGPAHPQPMATGSSSLSQLKSEIGRHDRIRVRLHANDRVVEISDPELGPDGITFSLGSFLSPASPIALETVQEIQVPATSVGPGARTGARVGAVLGAVAVVVASVSCSGCGSPSALESVASVGLGAFVGGLVGALMGVLVSVSHPGWQIIHPATVTDTEASRSPASPVGPAPMVRMAWRF